MGGARGPAKRRVYHDNRGDTEVAFGYVYAETGERAVRIGYGTHEDHIHVFMGNWGEPTASELRAMGLHLKTMFPGMTITGEPLRGCA